MKLIASRTEGIFLPVAVGERSEKKIQGDRLATLFIYEATITLSHSL